MYKTNNKLIKNISDEFKMTYNEIDDIIKKLFSVIADYIINRKTFYMDRLGILGIENNDIILKNENENFDGSLESINIEGNIKNIFLEKSIYKNIFKNIKDILKEENVYIKDFGTFSKRKNIKFDADYYLKNKLKQLNSNEIIEDISDESDSEIKYKKNNYNDDIIEEVVEISDKSIDDNAIRNICKNKTYNSIDVTSIIKNLNEKERNEGKTKDDNKKLDINNLNRKYPEAAYPDKKEIKKYESRYSEEKTHIKSENGKLFYGIIKVACIIIFILIIGLLLSIYYNGNKTSLVNNSIENQKLYDIVNMYFNSIDSANLSYITTKDMYYWDIAKTLYKDATYWTLLYAYNSDKYKISNIIKKGSSILYRNIPDFNSIKEIKYLYNTLSKSYIYIYPILANDKETKHALWSLKLSAYYDLDVFKNNSNIMPKEIYNNILQNNNEKNTCNEAVKYGKLNKNIFLPLFEIIKEKLGINK